MNPTRALPETAERRCNRECSVAIEKISLDTEELCTITVKMPRKRKIKKEPEDSFEPHSGEKRVKIEQKEDQSTLSSTRARDLAAAAALARLEQRNNPKTEANQQAEIRGDSDDNDDSDDIDDIPFPRFIPAPRAVKEVIFPHNMMRKIEALKARTGDTTSKNVIYIVAHELKGGWIDPDFTIVGGYHGFQSANERVMKYFSELDINIYDDRWHEASSREPPYSYFDNQTWHIGLDGCLKLYYDDRKHGQHEVYTKRVEIVG